MSSFFCEFNLLIRPAPQDISCGAERYGFEFASGRITREIIRNSLNISRESAINTI